MTRPAGSSFTFLHDCRSVGTSGSLNLDIPANSVGTIAHLVGQIEEEWALNRTMAQGRRGLLRPLLAEAGAEPA